MNQEEEALKREVEQKARAPEGRLTNMGYLTRDTDVRLDADEESLPEGQSGPLIKLD